MVTSIISEKSVRFVDIDRFTFIKPDDGPAHTEYAIIVNKTKNRDTRITPHSIMIIYFIPIQPTLTLSPGLIIKDASSGQYLITKKGMGLMDLIRKLFSFTVPGS